MGGSGDGFFFQERDRVREKESEIGNEGERHATGFQLGKEIFVFVIIIILFY